MIYLQPGAVDTLSPFALFENRFAIGALSAVNTDAAFPVANVLGPQTFDFWKASALPAEFSVTLAAAASVDCIALAAHNLGTVGASVSLFYSLTDVSGWLSLATFTPPDNDPVAAVFPAVSGRRFRVVINSASAMPFIGVAQAGRRLVIPAELPPGYVTAPNARRADVYPSLSLEGQFLGARVRRRSGDMSISLSPVGRTWADANLPAFKAHYDAGQPFFWAGSPGTYADDLAFAWRSEGSSELRPTLTPGGRMVTFGMELATYGA